MSTMWYQRCKWKKLRLVSCSTPSWWQRFLVSCFSLPAPSGWGETRSAKTESRSPSGLCFGAVALEREEWWGDIRDSFKVWNSSAKEKDTGFLHAQAKMDESYDLSFCKGRKGKQKKSQKEKEEDMKDKEKTGAAFWRDAQRGQGAIRKIERLILVYDRVGGNHEFRKKLNKLYLSIRKHSKYSKWCRPTHDALIEQNATCIWVARRIWSIVKNNSKKLKN